MNSGATGYSTSSDSALYPLTHIDGLGSLLADVTTDFAEAMLSFFGVTAEQRRILNAVMRPEIEFYEVDIFGIAPRELDKRMKTAMQELQGANAKPAFVLRFLLELSSGVGNYMWVPSLGWSDLENSFELSFPYHPKHITVDIFHELRIIHHLTIGEPLRKLQKSYEPLKSNWKEGRRSDWDQIAYEGIYKNLTDIPNVLASAENKLIRDFSAKAVAVFDTQTRAAIHEELLSLLNARPRGLLNKADAKPHFLSFHEIVARTEREWTVLEKALRKIA